MARRTRAKVSLSSGLAGPQGPPGTPGTTPTPATPANAIQYNSNPAGTFSGNINLLFDPNAIGIATIYVGSALRPGELDLFDNANGNKLRIFAAPNLGGNRVILLPGSSPTAGYVVGTDASGQWSYSDVTTLIPPNTYDTYGAAAGAQSAAEAARSSSGGYGTLQAGDGAGGFITYPNPVPVAVGPNGTPQASDGAGALKVWDSTSPALATFSPTVNSNWSGIPPTSLQEAIDRLAAAFNAAIGNAGLVLSLP